MGFALSVYFGFCLAIIGLASTLWGIGPSLTVFISFCTVCSAVAFWLIRQDERHRTVPEDLDMYYLPLMASYYADLEQLRVQFWSVLGKDAGELEFQSVLAESMRANGPLTWFLKNRLWKLSH